MSNIVQGISQFLSTPSARRATCRDCQRNHTWRFLSTPSARRATACENHRTRPECYFYPRPPRGGRPDYLLSVGVSLLYFYPRPPRGGRRVSWQCQERNRPFLSTPSARRATSIFKKKTTAKTYFYPRPPRGGRRVIDGNNAVSYEISIHALREEGDWRDEPATGNLSISIHALREEGDSKNTGTAGSLQNFYPRPPRGGRRKST